MWGNKEHRGHLDPHPPAGRNTGHMLCTDISGGVYTEKLKKILLNVCNLFFLNACDMFQLDFGSRR